MKTYQELWDKYKSDIEDSNFGNIYMLYESSFYDALADHDQEIKDKIKDEIEQYKILINGSSRDIDDLAYMQAMVALAELLNWMEE